MDPQRHEELRREHHPEAIRKRLRATPTGQSISDAILGGIDGCVTTFAIVAGAIGANFSPAVAIILGVANLLADGFSMAISNFEAIRAQQDYADSLRESEREHIAHVPEGEREEIRQIFAAKGFAGETLEEIVNTICSDPHLWVETMLKEEHGVHDEGLKPGRSAAVTFASFVIVGAIPLLPFLWPGLSDSRRFLLSCLLAALTFFSIGWLKSLVLDMRPWRAAWRTLLTGGAAAGLAYGSAMLLRGLAEGSGF